MLPADSPFASLPAPGPHPATAELRAYAAGTLGPADEHRIEAHALDCARCAELLEGFSMSDAATTEQALAGLHTRLQARVADDTAPVVLPAGRQLWPRLAAAAALLSAIAGGIWSWEQRHPATEVATVPHETAAPAAKPRPASADTIATAKPPRMAVATPAAAPSLATDYATVAPRRVASPRLSRRPGRSAAPALADQHIDAADSLARQATASITEAKKLVGRTAAPSANDLAANVSTQAAIALRVAPAKAVARADTGAAGQQETIASRYSKAKSFESAALVQDKAMPAVPTIAPAPVAGTPALFTYLHREAAEFEPAEGTKRLNGVVRLRFVVGADGMLRNLQVVRGMRADYDEEALRMVCEGPAWRPGIAGGRRAALPMEISVSF